jgi:putative transcriptional regulator
MLMRGDASISTSGRCYLRLIERLLATLIVSFITPGSVGLSAAEKNQYLAGQLLVASPEMRDPRFVETVIYMVSHDASGALGVIINRPIAKGTFGDLLKAFDAESDGAEGEVIIHYGGPVSPNLGFILHSDDYLLKESTVVRDGIAMTAAAEVVRAMSLGKGPSQALIVLGYAGWAPGQLEGEIQNNHWFTIPADKTLIFSGQPEKKWEQAIERRRITL